MPRAAVAKIFIYFAFSLKLFSGASSLRQLRGMFYFCSAYSVTDKGLLWTSLDSTGLSVASSARLIRFKHHP
jgi:hypothetical protein